MLDELQFTRLDFALARFLTQRSQLDDSGQRAKFESIVLRLSYAQNYGHSCIELNNTEFSIVLASGMANELGSYPLVLEGKRLYLQRYWQYECQIAEKLFALISAEESLASHSNVTKVINRFFPLQNDVDWQKNAAEAAVNFPFVIVTGGPGTGKTTTVVNILAILQELSALPLNIALAAPTGKAAMRLQESIALNKLRLSCADNIKKLIPEKVVTIHSLLGARPPSSYFKYNADFPLSFDVVVIDEASMVDLPLMSKLLNALKDQARLVLLGDKDQLASVETGAVLANLTEALPKYSQELKTSYRFSGKIRELSEAVNKQDTENAWKILEQNYSDVGLLQEDVIDYIAGKQVAYLRLIDEGSDFDRVYAAFNEFQVLCANRRGHYSVEDINYRVTQVLKNKNYLHGPVSEWFVGRPVLITQNDPVLHLYNGDIGLCLADNETGGQLKVYFLMPDGCIKKYLPARLPKCETVFAMTIHKSQGSEFNEVLMILPDEINPILTKELIYTGITRAKKSVKIKSKKQVFFQALQRKVDRTSGLVEKLIKLV